MTSVWNRQGLAIVSLVGLFVAGYMLLYKLGAFGSILCGTGACETVQNSPWAYFLGVPVAAWGVLGFLAIFVTALAGTRPGLADSPWVAMALFGLTTLAVAFSAYLTWLEAAVIHAWCLWCVASAILSVLAFLLALPEIRRFRRPEHDPTP